MWPVWFYTLELLDNISCFPPSTKTMQRVSARLPATPGPHDQGSSTPAPTHAHLRIAPTHPHAVPSAHVRPFIPHTRFVTTQSVHTCTVVTFPKFKYASAKNCTSSSVNLHRSWSVSLTTTEGALMKGSLFCKREKKKSDATCAADDPTRGDTSVARGAGVPKARLPCDRAGVQCHGFLCDPLLVIYGAIPT